MRRSILALLLFVTPAFAQDQAAAARAAAGCGPDQIEFDVKADDTQHPASQPESGKALVYVFHEERQNKGVLNKGWVTTRVGLDGTWIGANHGKSYFFFSVDPGDHRLCANWQSKIKVYSRQSAAASFVAEAGKVYYFCAQVNEITDIQHEPTMKLELVDPAEAQLLIASSAFSTFRRKK
jgi:YHS domain-containing protein